MIKSIPTTYDGVTFRSRLEARWAAFFDVVGWRWEYEPCDYPGWTPDFILIGATGIIPVEVKPINPMWQGCVAAEAQYGDSLKKVREHVATEECEALVLGCYPVECKGVHSSICIGSFLDGYRGVPFADPAFIGAGYGSIKADFFSDQQGYQYRIGGEHDGDGHIKELSISDLRKHWGEAGKRVQWKGAR